MCSYYIKEYTGDKWHHIVFPQCENYDKEKFIIYFHTEIMNNQEEAVYELKYVDSTSVITETFKVAKCITNLLFSNVPVEQIPKIVFADKWRAVSMSKEYKLLPALE